MNIHQDTTLYMLAHELLRAEEETAHPISLEDWQAQRARRHVLESHVRQCEQTVTSLRQRLDALPTLARPEHVRWAQLLAALVVGGLCLYIGKLILPVVQTMTPVIAWTLTNAAFCRATSRGKNSCLCRRSPPTASRCLAMCISRKTTAPAQLAMPVNWPPGFCRRRAT